MIRRNPMIGLVLLALSASAGQLVAGENMPRRTADIPVAFTGAVLDQGMDIHTERHRGWRGTRGCAPYDATRQARQEGMPRPTVADINRRRIVVEGNGRFGWGRMVFANMPGCPVIIR